jgi:transposase
MRQRRAMVEHPFGTMKARMGAVHFLMKTLPRVAGEMALHILALSHLSPEARERHHQRPAQ